MSIHFIYLEYVYNNQNKTHTHEREREREREREKKENNKATTKEREQGEVVRKGILSSHHHRTWLGSRLTQRSLYVPL